MSVIASMLPGHLSPSNAQQTSGNIFGMSHCRQNLLALYSGEFQGKQYIDKGKYLITSMFTNVSKKGIFRKIRCVSSMWVCVLSVMYDKIAV